MKSYLPLEIVILDWIAENLFPFCYRYLVYDGILLGTQFNHSIHILVRSNIGSNVLPWN